MKDPEPHIGYRTYIYVWLCLLLLTAVTIAAAGMDIAKFRVLIPVLIASGKALLVLMFFMHLKNEGKLLISLVSVAVLSLAALISLTFLDVWYR